MGRLLDPEAGGMATSRGARRGRARHGRTGAPRRLFTGALALSLAVTGAVALGAPATATPITEASPGVARTLASTESVAGEYPTWQEVRRAKRKAAQAKAMVARIQADIAALEKVVARKEADAKAKGEIYATAQEAYDTKAYETEQLLSQAEAAQTEADDAIRDAARSIAEIGRTGGGDLTATLLAQSGDADGLLYRLGAASRIGERSTQTYERAIQLQQNAQSLGDQAAVAQAEVKVLKKAAQKAYRAARDAAAAAEAELADERAQQEQLQEQLDLLTLSAKQIQKKHNEGVRKGEVAGGWALPAVGCITDNFGQRYHPIYHYWTLHSGVDIGAGYDQPIRAASAGRVVYAGWYSDLGYFVKIDHGNGIVTGYGHIREGGLRVHYGETVNPGQLIAKVGSTGGSTGPHLHFMMWRNGGLIDPVPFMREHGVRIGC